MAPRAAAGGDPEAVQRRVVREALAKGLASELGGGEAFAGRQDGASRALPAALRRAKGLDVTIKAQKRKARYLLSFPGKIRPAKAGVFGDVVGLGTSTPTLYVHFPQGRLRLSGARVFPNARYVMLRVGKAEAAVEEVFDSLVSFSEFAWVGQQADNPDDEKLEMPAGVLEANVHGSDLRTAVAVGGSSDGGGSAKRGAAGRRSRAPVPGPETATQPQMQDEGDFFLSQQSTQPASQATRVEDAADGDAEGASASGEDCGEAETSPTPRRAASRRSGRERGRVNYAEADGDDSEDDDSEDVDEIIDLCSDD